MQNRTVQITIYTLLIAAALLVAVGTLSLQTLAQEGEPDFLPIVPKEFSSSEEPPAEVGNGGQAASETEPSAFFISGYSVPEAVYNFYQKLGPEVAGRPLTDYHLNENANRYEMLFENIGLYVHTNDPSATVKLLPLGVRQAFGESIATPQPEAIPLPPSILRLFDLTSSQLGNQLKGAELVSLTFDENGWPTRIFENVVLKIDPAAPEAVEWQPLPEILGVKPQPAVPPLVGDDRFYFSATEGNLGHNVPMDFWNFIRSQAGLNVSGKPITEIFYPDATTNLIRQCFEHLCLDYDLTDGSIRPTRLGVEYYRQFQDQPSAPEDLSLVDLRVWESQPAIPVDQNQIISARIAQKNLPVVNLQPVLEISLPDGSQLTYNMPPSDQNGVSSLQIPPVGATNGSIIPYQVCIVHADATRFCTSEQFMIWNSP